MDPAGAVAPDPRLQRTRRRALTAARQLLLAEGVDAVTHQRVAEAAGVGRRSMYRHWSDRRRLLVDTLAMTSAPRPPSDGDLRTALIDHLEAFATALYEGPLALVLATLHERAQHDPDYREVMAELVEAGCAPLRELLGRPRPPWTGSLDVELAVAVLEGPVLHAAMLRRGRLSEDQVIGVVDRFLSAPPAK